MTINRNIHIKLKCYDYQLCIIVMIMNMVIIIFLRDVEGEGVRPELLQVPLPQKGAVARVRAAYICRGLQ